MPERLARAPVLPLGLPRTRAMGGGAAIGLFDFGLGSYGVLFTVGLHVGTGAVAALPAPLSCCSRRWR